MISVEIDCDKDFEEKYRELREKYGEDFEYLNGLHKDQMVFSKFFKNFEKKNVADATIDSNANARQKDICSLLNEKNKPQDKLIALAKIYAEVKKKYDRSTADEWLEQEWTGGFYLHDASSTTFKPYCFRGDTKIMTTRGILRLDEHVGEKVKVIGKTRKWEDGVIKHFGKSVLMRICLERYGVTKEIYCTPNHRWFVKKIKSGNLEVVDTENLKVGYRIPHARTHQSGNMEPSPFGVAHGFFTGDGYKHPKHPRANFCGEKTALIPYFTPARITGEDREYTMCGIPYYFNSLPPLSENKSYLLGWLAGYFAADGCVNERGECTIASTSIENIEHVRSVLCVLGKSICDIRYQDRISNLTGEYGRLYIISIDQWDFNEDFFVNPKHRRRISSIRSDDKKIRHDRNWIVRSVEMTDIEEDVYCVENPTSHSFTLDGNILTHNCYAYDLTRLAEEGLFFLSDYNNQPPKHLTTFLDDVIEYVSFMSNRSSGACGLPNLLIWTYYFWQKDVKEGFYIKDPDYYLKQCFQKFIYRINQPFLRVDQSAFVNVSIFDRVYINDLFGETMYPDETFVFEHAEGLIEHQKAFMEVVSDIRSSNMFTFPVLTYSLIYRGGKFVDEDFARWCSDHNTTWNDSNFFMSDNAGTLSNCCRLLSDTQKLKGFINSIGGTAISIGSVKVNTINLVRLAYESGLDKGKFEEMLYQRTYLCCQVLDVIRDIIKKNIDKGLLPNYCEGGVDMKQQYSTIGILGLYEVMEVFDLTERDAFGNVYYKDEAIDFASVIFKVLNRVKETFTQAYSFNIESVPAERAAVILAQKDAKLFDSDYEIYSNQWIPLTQKCTINEKLRLSSIIDKKCSGGAIAHINLEKNFPNTDTAWDMLNHIASQGVIYFAFNTRINECENHHGFVGTDICPECGKPVFDTYQRIVGFLEPVRSYSKERKREFSFREWYDYAGLKRE